MTNSFSRLDFPFSCDKISDLTNLFFFAFSASSSSRPLWGTGAGGDSKERQWSQWCLLGWRCRWSCCGNSERQATSEQQGNIALSESSQWCRCCCWASRRSRGWTGDHLWPKAESVHHTPHCTTSASAARIASGAAAAQLRCSRIASACRTVAGAKPGGKSEGGDVAEGVVHRRRRLHFVKKFLQPAVTEAWSRLHDSFHNAGCKTATTTATTRVAATTTICTTATWITATAAKLLPVAIKVVNFAAFRRRTLTNFGFLSLFWEQIRN